MPLVVSHTHLVQRLQCQKRRNVKIGDKTMTREEAKALLPIMQAFAEGKTIEFRACDREWKVTNTPTWSSHLFYRIKPEPKYRPFKTQEECWNEMQKHQPFGWVRSIKSDNLYLIDSISDEIHYNRTFASYNESFEWVKFVDGTPFGIKE